VTAQDDAETEAERAELAFFLATLDAEIEHQIDDAEAGGS
jgi:hypothetical protein